ncbi:MAG: zf-HC2 domain-containing protein, partial [Candidatus Deferrimicrobium sp.]
MDCPRARNLLSEYQDGTLDAAAEAALTTHLRGCGECAACAGSLLAVREFLRLLPPDPAPPELLARVVAAVETEDRNAPADSASGGTHATRPFLSRFRVPLQAAAAVLLFASVYWYQQSSAPPARPPSGPSSAISSETGKGSSSGPVAAKKRAAENPPSGIRLPRGNPKTPKKEEGYAAAKPRTWTAASLPSVPVVRASTDAERIVPFAPSTWPTIDPVTGEAPAFQGRRSTEREIAVEVKPENREGAEERIAEAALRLGGVVERIEHA